MRKVTGISDIKKAIKLLDKVNDLLYAVKAKRTDYYNDKSEGWRYQDRGCEYFDKTELIEDYRSDLADLRSELEPWIDSE